MKKALLSIGLILIPVVLFIYSLQIQQNINIWPWDNDWTIFTKIVFGQMSHVFLTYLLLVSWGGIVYLWLKEVPEIIIERLCATLLIGTMVFSVAKNIYYLAG